MDFIFVEGLQVEASIGIYQRELRTLQPLEIELNIGVPDGAGAHDDIADTIDYDKVVERIRQLLTERHFMLLETLGESIAELLISEFASPWVRVSIAKMGVMRGVKRVGVLIERGREGISPPRL
ncbi:dihydroneopterin aldolase [Niveibacterium terrae]|uniref:dihydroneopterin aldolase n=1 Tax=Niveibacterium terrae TaxID=3373598 RepID=UPI003A911B30